MLSNILHFSLEHELGKKDEGERTRERRKSARMLAEKESRTKHEVVEVKRNGRKEGRRFV